ncbi:uncharacterized protein LOC125649653 isoform X1 [Ostrea edulis]|uniref:uncharacterized protein LOC125649653 isoform X1 n=2 Tax=Ostrea edulis TaxID=37623 RepID=UPI0024AEB865|nr:uncharacterized protein LOC125649653 isoform X1 [Ostrea edulis]
MFDCVQVYNVVIVMGKLNFIVSLCLLWTACLAQGTKQKVFPQSAYRTWVDAESSCRKDGLGLLLNLNTATSSSSTELEDSITDRDPYWTGGYRLSLFYWNYGCFTSASVAPYIYIDTIGGNGNTNSVTQCAIFCGKKKRWIGLLKSFCYCLDLSDGDRQTSLVTSQCRTPCPGEKRDACGDDEAMSVYKLLNGTEIADNIANERLKDNQRCTYIANNTGTMEWKMDDCAQKKLVLCENKTKSGVEFVTPHNTVQDWFTATQNCRDKNMEMAVVTLKDINRKSINRLPPNIQVWVGLYRHDLSLWTDKDMKDDPTSCLAVEKDTFGDLIRKWHPCSNQYKYVCLSDGASPTVESAVIGTPAPTTMSTEQTTIITTGETTIPTTVQTTIPTTEQTVYPTTEETTIPITEQTIIPTTEQTTIPAVEKTTIPTVEQTTVPTTEQTTIPTTEQTTIPTTEQTTVPTTEQTTIPTTEQTTVPTTEQTTVPTTEQTTVPTTEQTTVPTTEQTTVPTTEQTTVPTTEQTTIPTTEQTTVPTTEQTTVPTTEQTTVPTTEQTTVPTTEQSTVPTTVHTTVPTTEQTTIPTTEQTTVPTTVQTTVPTTEQTTVPTTEQTTVPTTEQTTVPTTVHTTVPTTEQTTIPTTEQTTVPTTVQTTIPTTEQTTVPTTVQTTIPTTEQTTVPTTEQTTIPTTEQTTLPTTEHTTIPTTEQTTIPTTEQTTVPTTEQTTLPTVEQTTLPTTVQTTVPTTEQTTLPTKEKTTLPTTEQTTIATTEQTTYPTTVQTTYPTTVQTIIPTTITPPSTETPENVSDTIKPNRAKSSSHSDKIPTTELIVVIIVFAVVVLLAAFVFIQWLVRKRRKKSVNLNRRSTEVTFKGEDEMLIRSYHFSGETPKMSPKPLPRIDIEAGSLEVLSNIADNQQNLNGSNNTLDIPWIDASRNALDNISHSRDIELPSENIGARYQSAPELDRISDGTDEEDKTSSSTFMRTFSKQNHPVIESDL